MTFTESQRKALAILAEARAEGKRVYISSSTEGDCIANGTATKLEKDGLIYTEDVGRISETWICHLTVDGQRAAHEVAA